MSENKINPLEDWASEELSEAELDALAGGRTSSFSSLSMDTDLFAQDFNIIRQSDNMFTSFDGTKGSTLDATYSTATPLNLALAFP